VGLEAGTPAAGGGFRFDALTGGLELRLLLVKDCWHCVSGHPLFLPMEASYCVMFARKAPGSSFHLY
jgi:hypothetical protein